MAPRMSPATAPRPDSLPGPRIQGETGPGHPAPGGVALSAAILLWPNFPLMSLAGIVESLRHAGDLGDRSRQRFVRWDILGGRTRSSCGLSVEATADYVNPRCYDYLFVIGGLLRDLDRVPDRHLDYLHLARRAGCTIVGVCTGSFVLAAEGLLDGCTACVHPYHRADFETAFPRVKAVSDVDFEIAGKVVTVPGGISILPLMTRLIGRSFGPDRSAKTVHQLSLSARRAEAGADPSGMTRQLTITDPRIQTALVVLESRASRNPSIGALARSLGLSERHFLRLFRAHVGTSPKDYLVDQKLRAAVWLLRNSGASVTSIAYSTGFSSGASLADHCRRRLKTTPSALRRGARVAVDG